MAEQLHRWDFFLAHAAPDAAPAERLYALMSAECRVFLDSKCLRLGDDWDAELRAAQQQSATTVVLVSQHTDGAYYQREEVAAAIALARKDGERHRVVPLYLPGADLTPSHVPYGLRLKHGITLHSLSELGDAAARLLSLHRSASATEASTGRITADPKQEISRLLLELTANCAKRRALQIEEELYRIVHGDVELYLASVDQYSSPAREAMAVVGGRMLHAGCRDERLLRVLRGLAEDPDAWVRRKAQVGLKLAGH